jgi:hypothetical protein
LPVSDTIVSMTRSALSSEPLLHAQEDACAALEAERLPGRLDRTGLERHLVNCSALMSGSVAMTSPVAGFSTGNVASVVAPFVLVACSTVAMCPTSRCSGPDGLSSVLAADSRRRANRREA